MIRVAEQLTLLTAKRRETCLQGLLKIAIREPSVIRQLEMLEINKYLGNICDRIFFICV